MIPETCPTVRFNSMIPVYLNFLGAKTLEVGITCATSFPRVSHAFYAPTASHAALVFKHAFIDAEAPAPRREAMAKTLICTVVFVSKRGQEVDRSQ
jgi:hypothetical protein